MRYVWIKVTELHNNIIWKSLISRSILVHVDKINKFHSSAIMQTNKVTKLDFNIKSAPFAIYIQEFKPLASWGYFSLQPNSYCVLVIQRLVFPMFATSTSCIQNLTCCHKILGDVDPNKHHLNQMTLQQIIQIYPST